MRLLAALAVLAATVAAPPALAQGRTPMNAAVLLGFEDGEGPAGLALRGDIELPMKPISPGVGLSIVGSLGYSRFSDDGGTYDPFYGIDDRWEASLSIIKLVPAARLTFGRSAAVRPYVDAGIGLYYASFNYSESVYLGYPYYQNVQQKYDDSETSILLRLGAGVTFQVSPAFSLTGEVGITPYLGDYPDDTMLSMMIGAQFRM
jgi:opacity protein-like surface antigen